MCQTRRHVGAAERWERIPCVGREGLAAGRMACAAGMDRPCKGIFFPVRALLQEPVRSAESAPEAGSCTETDCTRPGRCTPAPATAGEEAAGAAGSPFRFRIVPLVPACRRPPEGFEGSRAGRAGSFSRSGGACGAGRARERPVSSMACDKFRVPESPSAGSRITPDNCRYRALYVNPVRCRFRARILHEKRSANAVSRHAVVI